MATPTALTLGNYAEASNAVKRHSLSSATRPTQPIALRTIAHFDNIRAYGQAPSNLTPVGGFASSPAYVASEIFPAQRVTAYLPH